MHLFHQLVRRGRSVRTRISCCGLSRRVSSQAERFRPATPSANSSFVRAKHKSPAKKQHPAFTCRPIARYRGRSPAPANDLPTTNTTRCWRSCKEFSPAMKIRFSSAPATTTSNLA